MRLAHHVNYNNAGTVEFLVDESGSVYFIEVNPKDSSRTYHYGGNYWIDIVRSQILIAAGNQMSDPRIYIRSQDDIQCMDLRYNVELPLKIQLMISSLIMGLLSLIEMLAGLEFV